MSEQLHVYVARRGLCPLLKRKSDGHYFVACAPRWDESDPPHALRKQSWDCYFREVRPATKRFWHRSPHYELTGNVWAFEWNPLRNFHRGVSQECPFDYVFPGEGPGFNETAGAER